MGQFYETLKNLMRQFFATIARFPLEIVGKQCNKSMKIRANDIDLRDAERFNSFSSVIFNCKKLNTAALMKS